MAAQDPFYLVRDEIQESVNKVQDGYTAFERLAMTDPQRDSMAKALLEESRSVEWQLEELSRAVNVAAKDPARFNINQNEIESRRSWTESARYQVRLVMQALEEAAQARAAMQREMARRELLKTSTQSSAAPSRNDLEPVRRTGSDDDRQALIVKEQDEQLDIMSRSLARIGNMGLAIHDELGAQDKIIGELNEGIDSTMARLDLIQKRMAALMKKMGVKGQLIMLVVLLLLFIILVVLLVYT